MRFFTLVLLLLVLVLSACGGRTEIRPMIGGQVDDFEDGDARTLLGTPWESVADGGETTSTIFIDTEGHMPGSTYHLTIGGTRPPGSAGNQVSGARAVLGDESSAVDVSTYDGLELALRELQGQQQTFVVQIATASVRDFDYYNAYVVANDEWTRFRIPFNRFSQEGFGRPVDFSGTDVTHVAVFSSGYGPYTLAVDNVRFYRAEADSSQSL
ncbi:MAG: hypothetical protein COV99_07560 [Bacteroidetes bacterium CG12_big_fil_rev_8_21_14_0_65_60_17]|nr:MAG: hypothetical protein COV99_07560 [Bacteroidetes bacterium CG12_big_fil_rev_8_21_14_0_65_60_17]